MALIRLKPASVPQQFNILAKTSAELKKLRDDVRAAGGELDIDQEISLFLDRFIVKARKELVSLRGCETKPTQAASGVIEAADGWLHGQA